MNVRHRWLSLVALFALSTTGCKLKMEGKVTGWKEGTADTVIIHVVSEKGADLSCTNCKTTTGTSSPFKVPDSGEMDVEYDLALANSKSVFISGKKGLKKNSIYIDVGGSTPAKLAVDGEHGQITCQPRECVGSFDLAPAPSVFLKTEPGAVLQVGTDKLTASADGVISGPLNLAMSPPLQKQRLDKICLGITYTKRTDVAVATTVSLTFADNSRSSAKADLGLDVVEKSFAKHLAEIEKGPIVFPWEKPGVKATGKRAAVFVYADDCYDAGAADATVADLDVIAVADGKTRTGECSYISKSSTAKGTMTMYDLHATAYDRITGKKLGEKLFPAPKDCLDSFTAAAGTTIAPGSTSYVDKEAVAKWAALFAR